MGKYSLLFGFIIILGTIILFGSRLNTNCGILEISEENRDLIYYQELMNYDNFLCFNEALKNCSKTKLIFRVTSVEVENVYQELTLVSLGESTDPYDSDSYCLVDKEEKFVGIKKAIDPTSFMEVMDDSRTTISESYRCKVPKGSLVSDLDETYCEEKT